MTHQRKKDILLDQALNNQIPADALDDELASLFETASQVHAILDETPPPPHGLRPGRSAFLTAAAQQPEKRKGFLFLPFPLSDFKRVLGWGMPIATVAVLAILLGTALFSSNTMEQQLPPEQTTSAPAVIETVQQGTKPSPAAEGIEPDIDDRGTLTPALVVTDDMPALTPGQKKKFSSDLPSKANNNAKTANATEEAPVVTSEPAAATDTSGNSQNSPPPSLNNPPAALPTAVVIVAPPGITVTSPLSITLTITPPSRGNRPRVPRPPRIPKH
jgi:hypothetical protein